jgi:SNF2 family DNA or RNA helicase
LKLSEILEKLAELNPDVKLYPHQQRVVDNPATSQVIAHSVGSGKTLTSIAKFEKMKHEGKAKRALVIVPAGLRDNFGHSNVKKFTNSKYNIVGTQQEIKKRTHKGIDPEADYNIVSYDIFKRNPEKFILDSGADTVISDESHRGKNEDTKLTKSLKRARKLYANHIGLTGSIVSNSLADIHPLVDVASAGRHNLGKDKKEFEKKYIVRSNAPKYRDLPEKRRPVVGFKNEKELKKHLMANIDYADFEDIKDIANMPGKNLKIRKVPLSSEQVKAYKKILNKHPGIMKLIKMKRLETLKDEEAAKAFSGLIEARKLMNSMGSVRPGMSAAESAEVTPKTRKLLDDLTQHLGSRKDAKALLFSHLITGGVDTLEAGLRQRKIPYGRFIGKGNPGSTEEIRQQDVTDYNTGKKKVMLVSSAGGEGLSLDNTTWEGVLDPHYNPEKMKQMEARGIRSGGLSHLPQNERHVQVNRYLATMPSFLGIFKSRLKTPDEFIYEIASHKDAQNQKLFNLLKDIQSKKRFEAPKKGDVIRSVTPMPQPSDYSV